MGKKLSVPVKWEGYGETILLADFGFPIGKLKLASMYPGYDGGFWWSVVNSTTHALAPSKEAAEAAAERALGITEEE